MGKQKQIEEYTKLMAVGGGQAFPTPAHRIDEGTHLVGTPGITYLDYMAGQALLGLLTDRKFTTRIVAKDMGLSKTLARFSYDLAAAMRAERDKP